MINTVKLSSFLNDPRDDRRSPRQPSREEAEASTSAQSANSPSDVRLVIEQDAASGALVYRLIDRVTGEVISEVSRDALIKMGADPLYSAGKVINTKA